MASAGLLIRSDRVDEGGATVNVLDQPTDAVESADTQPSAGVVICAFTMDRWDQLSAGVHAVVGQLGPADRVVVVIDHNEELLNRARTSLACERVDVIPNAGHVGLSAGRNTGVGACGRDLVLFLDDDAMPEAGWLQAFRARFAANAAVVAVGGGVQPAWEGGRAPRWFPAEFGWVVGCDYRGMPPSGSRIRNPIGASMGIRSSAFAVAGGFSETVGRVASVPLGCEETELSIRIRRLIPGSIILRDTAAMVRHFVPRSRQTAKYFVSRCYHEGQSKAAITRLAGSADSLSSERSYATRTLVSGVLLHCREAARGDIAGIARAAMLPVGLFVTAAGYAKSMLGQRRRRS